MPSVYDASEFVDPDARVDRPERRPDGPWRENSARILTREELESKVLETQRRLAELKQAQEALERERAALEELRRRQTEFQTGREEMLRHLTRGIALLEEAEQETRHQAELMASTLQAFRTALDKIRAIREEAWTPESLNIELTRALTVIENARMEWNSARLKLPVLQRTGDLPEGNPNPGTSAPGIIDWPRTSFGQLCRVGLALTWPVALVVLLVGLLGLFLR